MERSPSYTLITAHLAFSVHSSSFMEPSHPPWFDHPTNIWRGVQSMKLLIILQNPVTSSLFGPNILHTAPLSCFIMIYMYILVLLLSKAEESWLVTPDKHFSALCLCKHEKALCLIIYSWPRHVSVRSQGVASSAVRNRNPINCEFLWIQETSTDGPK
jgi:hypothetical protein